MRESAIELASRAAPPPLATRGKEWHARSDRRRDGGTMGFWHTGYMEFHEPTGLDRRWVALPQTWRCDQCAAEFDGADELKRHRFENHPLIRPSLMIHGTVLGAAPYRVTMQGTAQDFTTELTTAATINGESVPVTDIPGRLAGFRSETVRVKLANEMTDAGFVVIFDVPTLADVRGVEQQFARMAKGRELKQPSIEAFIAGCAPFKTAIGLCDGITRYLYAVLAKEGGHDAVHEPYDFQMNAAAEKLGGYPAVPLARLILALVAFHFNQLAACVAYAPGTRIAAAATILRKALDGRIRAMAGHSDVPAPAEEDSLTDSITRDVLGFVLAFGAGRGATVADLERVRTVVPAPDAAKLSILIAETHMHLRNLEAARSEARPLLNNPLTGNWAQSLLDRSLKART